LGPWGKNAPSLAVSPDPSDSRTIHGPWAKVVDTKWDRGARARIRCYLTLGPRTDTQSTRHWTADLGTEIASYQMTVGAIDLGSLRVRVVPRGWKWLQRDETHDSIPAPKRCTGSCEEPVLCCTLKGLLITSSSKVQIGAGPECCGEGNGD